MASGLKIPFWCYWIVISSIIWTSHGSRILLLPFPWGSHISSLVSIGTTLVDKGHEVHMMLPPSYPYISRWHGQSDIKIIEYKIIEPDIFSRPVSANSAFWDMMTSTPPLQLARMTGDVWKQICTNPLQDLDLHKELESLRFDLAIVDALHGHRCMYILLYKLDIPYVSFNTFYDPWLSKMPALPSFVPFQQIFPALSEEMTFWERLTNLYNYIDWIAFPQMAQLNEEWVKEFAPDKLPVTINYLAGRSLLWLIDTDNVLDNLKPVMPNEVNVGCLLTTPSKPLPSDLEKFVSSAPQGTIVVAFGSDKTIPEKNLIKFLTTFQSLTKYHIVWSSTLTVENLPKNIRIMKYIPQNDLLGHPSTKLLITHCGMNSQCEALYHGVPMIGLPIMGDQYYNCKRAQHKQLGISMHFVDFEPEELAKNIDFVISNPVYKANCKQAGEIMRSAPMRPSKRAAYWIEHVLKFGGEHLHSHALDMPWYEYLMLDILAFLLICGLIIISISWCLLVRCVRVCCRSKGKIKQQ